MRIEKRVYSNVFTPKEVDDLLSIIESKKDNIGFGVRYFLKNNPIVLRWIVENENLMKIICHYFEDPVILKSIYFDKPSKSNWTVNWHQDITLNLEPESEFANGINRRELADKVVIQPELEILNGIMTFRIHFDDTSEANGALSIVEHSEREGIVRVDKEYIERNKDRIEMCIVPKGGVMLMSPLTVHSSRRVSNSDLRRRVLHLEVAEFSTMGGVPLLEHYKI